MPSDLSCSDSEFAYFVLGGLCQFFVLFLLVRGQTCVEVQYGIYFKVDRSQARIEMTLSLLSYKANLATVFVVISKANSRS